MHELSLCRALVTRLEQMVQAHGAASASAVVIAVGPFSGIHARELEEAFPVAAAGTPLAGARLEVRSAAARWRCRGCGAEVTGGAEAPCTHCGAGDLQLLDGDGIVIERLELSP